MTRPDLPDPTAPGYFAALVEWLRDARAVVAEHQAGRPGCPECDGHGHTLRMSRATVDSIATHRPADRFVHFGGGIRFDVDEMVAPGRVLQVRCWTCGPGPPPMG